MNPCQAIILYPPVYAPLPEPKTENPVAVEAVETPAPAEPKSTISVIVTIALNALELLLIGGALYLGVTMAFRLTKAAVINLTMQQIKPYLIGVGILLGLALLAKKIEDSIKELLGDREKYEGPDLVFETPLDRFRQKFWSLVGRLERLDENFTLLGDLDYIYSRIFGIATAKELRQLQSKDPWDDQCLTQQDLYFFEAFRRTLFSPAICAPLIKTSLAFFPLVFSYYAVIGLGYQLMQLPVSLAKIFPLMFASNSLEQVNESYRPGNRVDKMNAYFEKQLYLAAEDLNLLLEEREEGGNEFSAALQEQITEKLAILRRLDRSTCRAFPFYEPNYRHLKQYGFKNFAFYATLQEMKEAGIIPAEPAK